MEENTKTDKMKRRKGNSIIDNNGRKVFDGEDIFINTSAGVKYGVAFEHPDGSWTLYMKDGSEIKTDEFYAIRRFIKRPQTTDLVKVYKGNEGRHGYDYGRVIRVEIGIDWEQPEIEGKYALREIAVLHKVCGEYDLNSIDFFLQSTKVKFEEL